MSSAFAAATTAAGSSRRRRSRAWRVHIGARREGERRSLGAGLNLRLERRARGAEPREEPRRISPHLCLSRAQDAFASGFEIGLAVEVVALGEWVLVPLLAVHF